MKILSRKLNGRVLGCQSKMKYKLEYFCFLLSKIMYNDLAHVNDPGFELTKWEVYIFSNDRIKWVKSCFIEWGIYHMKMKTKSLYGENCRMRAE